MLPYTLTNESITVIAGGQPRVAQRGTVLFNELRTAVMKGDWTQVNELLTSKEATVKWLRDAGPDFGLADGKITFRGEPLPGNLGERAQKMADDGDSPSALLRFYERLRQNPSKRSVDQLWDFLQHQGIPLEASGHFRAYKGVREDLKDAHSGKFDNSPGKVHEMPRNEISDDPRQACHEGFHVGALSYAASFSARTMVVRVDPADVVCVPYDESQRKMRVCKYEVIGFHGDDTAEHPMRDTVVDQAEVEAEDKVSRTHHPAAGDKRRLGKLPPGKLMKETIDVLRGYALALKITGATRMPGGKIALVKRIAQVRRRK